jgi:hypothetical protein
MRLHPAIDRRNRPLVSAVSSLASVGELRIDLRTHSRRQVVRQLAAAV